MNELFVFALQNTVIAIGFALFVAALTRLWRNPPLAHVLWLLVLLKLVAPPLVSIAWSAPWLAESTATSGQIFADVPQTGRAAIPAAAQPRATNRQKPEIAGRIGDFWISVRPVLLWLWLGGAAVCALVAVTRIVRFERRLRDTLPASKRLQRRAIEIGTRLGVRRMPQVRIAECVDVPLLWCAGRRPTIVLPRRLLGQLDEERLSLILAHELAHLRRRDHWVRAVELAVSAVYWWNPLVWLIRRRIHHTEDLCCDAWVRWAYPDCARRYTELLLLSAESLGAAPLGPRLLPASPFLHSPTLKARIEIMLECRFAPHVSVRSRLVIALLALLVLPAFVEITATKALAASSDEVSVKPADKADTLSTSEFPYAVKFEQGATRLENGDQITIVEVRGTADTFIPGHIYWIKGTYTLASRDRAGLSAYTTAKHSKDGTGSSYRAQSTAVQRGSGTFTLFLPMSCEGWPHVSFYPAGNGSDFGGSYFGTGDSVLKKWWGSKETD